MYNNFFFYPFVITACLLFLVSTEEKFDKIPKNCLPRNNDAHYFEMLKKALYFPYRIIFNCDVNEDEKVALSRRYNEFSEKTKYCHYVEEKEYICYDLSKPAYCYYEFHRQTRCLNFLQIRNYQLNKNDIPDLQSISTGECFEVIVRFQTEDDVIVNHQQYIFECTNEAEKEDKSNNQLPNNYFLALSENGFFQFERYTKDKDEGPYRVLDFVKIPIEPLEGE